MKFELFRTLTLILLLQCITNCLTGQNQREITVNIKNNESKTLPLALIEIDGKNHLIADNKGNTTFNSKEQKVNARISYLGYSTIDTTLDISTISYHKIVLFPDNYTLSPITISDSQNLFEKNNWWIKDIIIHEYGYLVSASEKSKMYIYLYDKNGNQILKTKTKFKHSTLLKGLKTGHYHLMNKKSGQELLVSTDTIIALETSPTELYDETINRFKYSNNNYSIIEEWSKHNKRYTLFKINNKTYEKSPFYSTSDMVGYARARKSYFKMIAMYNKAIDIDEPMDIDHGIKPPKIYNLAAWNGDVFTLIINNQIHGEYHNFINFLCAELKISTMVNKDNLYILDNFKKKLSIYNLKEGKIDEDNVQISIPEAIKNADFLMSDHEKELVLSSDNGYYLFDEANYKFRPISYKSQDPYFVKRAFVSKNQMITLAQKSAIKYKMHLYSGKLLDGH